MDYPKQPMFSIDHFKGLKVKDFLNQRSLGFACVRSWVYLLFLGVNASNVTWDGARLPDHIFILSAVVLCATLFSAALFKKRFERLASLTFFPFFGPTLTIAGTLLIVLIGLPGTTSAPFEILGTLFTGVGSGIIMISYGEAYRRSDPSKSIFEIPFSFFLASIIAFVASALPTIWTCLICIVLPAFSGLYLFTQKSAIKEDASPQDNSEIKLRGFAVRVGACACLIGLADGVVRIAFSSSGELPFESFGDLSLVAANLISLGIMYGCIILSQTASLRSVYKSVVFIMALFFMLLPVFSEFDFVESTISLTGYGTFNALMWILLVEISSRFKLSSSVVFGMGWGMVSLGVLLGSLAGVLLSAYAPFTPQMLSLIALVATLAILVSYMFIFTESDLLNLITPIKSNQEGSLQDKCIQIAEGYKLSTKETEVLILAAKGRSRARIQNELHIASGTVSTHMRHIYEKLGVHTKQELLDLIDETAGRESPRFSVEVLPRKSKKAE